jgi:hypothetical protein
MLSALLMMWANAGEPVCRPVHSRAQRIQGLGDSDAMTNVILRSRRSTEEKT